MTALIEILVTSMTEEERSLLLKAADGAGLSPGEFSTLEQLRLVEVEAATGATKLSGIGLEVVNRL